MIVDRNKGFSLVELMVAITLATLMSLGVLGIFVNQTGNITHESQRDIATLEANRSFDVLSRLLRQAYKADININYPTGTSLNQENTPEISNDAVVVDFLLPANFSIWPNDKPPYNNNAIRISWNNNSSSESGYKIQMAKANSLDALSSAPLQDIAGANSDSLARIINLDVWPMQNPRTTQASASADGEYGYLLRVTTRTANPDMSFENPDDPDGPLQRYRTHTVSGIIFPRN